MKEMLEQKSRQEIFQEIANELEDLLIKYDGEPIHGKDIVKNLKAGQITKENMDEFLDICVERQNEYQGADHDLKVDGQYVGTEDRVYNLERDATRLRELYAQLEKLIEKEE